MKIVKILLGIITFLVIGVAGLLAYVKFALPNVGEAPKMTVETTAARVERGKYLATHVAVCIDCHSKRDWTKFSGPPIVSTFGQGGEVFDQNFGFPGAYTSKNITPFGIGKWTDGEVFRAITSGVSKNGSALFNIMPHHLYGQSNDEDIKSIIAYIRTLPSIESNPAPSVSDFPMNFILNTIPKKPNFVPIPDQKDQVAYGKYVFNMAACGECHTKSEKGVPVEGMELAGGFEFPMPFGVLRSMNITSDKQTGIGNWSEEIFVNRFKSYADSNFNAPTVQAGEFNSIMPWVMYAGMKDEDLKAIFAYLKTVKPISNKVTRFTPK